MGIALAADEHVCVCQQGAVSRWSEGELNKCELNERGENGKERRLRLQLMSTCVFMSTRSCLTLE